MGASLATSVIFFWWFLGVYTNQSKQKILRINCIKSIGSQQPVVQGSFLRFFGGYRKVPGVRRERRGALPLALVLPLALSSRLTCACPRLKKKNSKLRHFLRKPISERIVIPQIFQPTVLEQLQNIGGRGSPFKKESIQR